MATIATNTYNFKLCFTTWVCPDWTAAALLDGMSAYEYEGVEFCMGRGHLHGVEIDSAAEYLADVRKQFDDAGKAIACLSAPYDLANPDENERNRMLEDLKQTLRVADQLGTPYVRISGGEFPNHVDHAGVIDYVSETLAEAAEYAEEEKLRSMVLLQTDGAMAHSKYIREVMHQVYSDKIGILWDVLDPIRRLEKPEESYDSIGEYVRHVHLHDATYNDDRLGLEECELGKGFVPVSRVVDLLKASLYRGYLCLDLTDPEAEVDPDELLPHYAQYIKNVIKGEDE